MRQSGRPYIVAINGVDAAGKTHFAADLARSLSALPVCVIHFDDFHQSRAVRNAGPDSIRNYLESSFDVARFEREILVPLRTPEGLNKTLRVLDLATDRFDRDVTYQTCQNSLVLIEGVFLFRADWLRYFDFKIFLAVEESIARQRGIDRDGRAMGATVTDRYDTKYIPAQRIYLARDRPIECADVVIDANDWAAPRIVRS